MYSYKGFLYSCLVDLLYVYICIFTSLNDLSFIHLLLVCQAKIQANYILVVDAFDVMRCHHNMNSTPSSPNNLFDLKLSTIET